VNVEEKLREAERSIYGEPYEVLLVIDPETGEVYWRFTDDEPDSVTVPIEVDTWGMITIHNHPESDNPFSQADITSAYWSGECESRVVAKDSRYVFRPNVCNMSEGDRYMDEAENAYQNEVMRVKGDNSAAAQIEIDHHIHTRAARAVGAYYARERHDYAKERA
jgi:hypothetical protein